MVLRRRRSLLDIDKIFEFIEEQMRRSFEMARRMLERFEFPEEEEYEGYRVPLMDLIDEGDKYVIELELPGLDKKDIQIYARDHVLEIVGKRRMEKREEKEGYLRLERAYTGFRRVITLPVDADVDKIKAKYENGILRIEIPKKAEAKGRKIEVE